MPERRSSLIAIGGFALLTVVSPAHAQQKTPPVPPAKAAPAPQPAPAQPVPAQPEPQGGKTAHALEGTWKVYWIDQNKASEMRIGQVTAVPNLTSLVGSMATLDGEACPLNGSVVDALTGTFLDGLETKAQQISAYVVIRAQCANRQVWIEGFGLPSGRVLISGRATMIATNGARSYFAVGIGR